MIRQTGLGILMFWSLCAAGQNYFSKRFEYGAPGWWDAANTVCRLADTYVMTGAYQYWSPHCIGFYKMDFQGNRITSRTYCHDTSEFYNDIGSVVAWNTDTLLACAQLSTQTADWWYDLGLLMYLDPNLDTLSTRKFGEQTAPHDTGYLFRQLTVDPARNIILTGAQYVNNPNSRDKIWLVKTDIKGNVKWKRIYGNGLHYGGHSVICTSDGGYAVGGYGFGIPIPPDYSGDPVLLKTDSAGNQQWWLNLGSWWPDTPARVCRSADGNIVVGTSWCDSVQGGGTVAAGNAFRRINIIKVDNNGNVLWNKKYGKSEMFQELINIRESGDGGFIACGFTSRFYPTSYDYAGWLLKTDGNGDSLWYRQYAIGNGQQSWNILFDIALTDDHGFLAAGHLAPAAGDTGSQDGWVLRVDSLGCENPAYCWVGVQPEPEPADAGAFRVFPNPARTKVTVQLRTDAGDGPVTLRLFDVFGREVRSVAVPRFEKLVRLDVADLPEGMYLVSVRSRNMSVMASKLLVSGLR